MLLDSSMILLMCLFAWHRFYVLLLAQTMPGSVDSPVYRPLLREASPNWAGLVFPLGVPILTQLSTVLPMVYVQLGCIPRLDRDVLFTTANAIFILVVIRVSRPLSGLCTRLLGLFIFDDR